MNKLSNIDEALAFGKAKLLNSCVKDAELSAEILLSDVIGLNRQALYSHFDDKLSEAQQKSYKEFILRRSKHEPVQYILGYTYFRGLKINVEPGVLIPRPETEQLVQFALNNLSKLDIKNPKVLDLCTGSACIACSLASELIDVKIVATDISSQAIACAEKNVAQFNYKEKIELIKCNMADEIYDNDFDLLISNPPYVPTGVYKGLDCEVRDYEPKLALEAGEDGLLYLDQIIDVAKNKLKTNGIAVLELHEDSLETAKQKFLDASFKDVKVYKDLASKPRYIIFSN